MHNQDEDVKSRILQATVKLLSEAADPDSITVRQIAREAGVGVGSINYHFQNKENLLNAAVAQEVGDTAASWYQPFASTDVPPEDRLRKLFTETARVLTRSPKFGQIIVRHSLMNSSFDVPRMIWPLLREIFGSEKSELEIRVIAFQLIIASQVAYLRPETFQLYCGADLQDAVQRDAVLNIMVDSILGKM